MSVILKKKQNDCCICAYASCEGVTWKVAKRRLKKHLVSRKRLGVCLKSVIDKGISGYSMISSGSFDTLNEVFNFGKGIIFISFGDGTGHALAWNGFKLIDHEANGRFNNKTDLGRMRDGEEVALVLVKKKSSFIVSVFSYLANVINKVKNKVN